MEVTILLKMCCNLENVYRKDRMFNEDYHLKESSSDWYSGRQTHMVPFSRIGTPLSRAIGDD